MKILVIDSYYRSLAFACELIHKSFDVEYVDLTNSMGPWSPEDWEGPFGFFQDEHALAQQAWFLRSSYTNQNVSQGMVVHADGFPLEFQGPLLDFHMQGKFDANVVNFIKGNTVECSFSSIKKTWPAMIAVAAAATRSEPDFKNPLPFFQDYHLRVPLRQDYVHVLDRAKDQGLKLIDTDTFLEGFSESAINQYRFVVTSLSSESFASLFAQNKNENLANSKITPIDKSKVLALYSGIVPPGWQWARYSFLMESLVPLDEWPLTFTYVSVLDEPWTGANLLVLKKTNYTNWWDIWLKIPYVPGKHQNVYQDYVDQIKSSMSRLVPELKVVEFRLPTQSVEGVKGVPFPVYNSNKGFKANLRNVYYLNEEFLTRFDLDNRSKCERDLIENFITLTQKK